MFQNTKALSIDWGKENVFHNQAITFSHNAIVPLGLLPCEIRVAFRGASQLRQSRATQRTVHALYFTVSTIHRTLIWTTRSLTCVCDLAHAYAHGISAYSLIQTSYVGTESVDHFKYLGRAIDSKL